MSDPFFSADDLRRVNSCMAPAFAQWCEAGDPGNYVDLARRLNKASIAAYQAVKDTRPQVCG